MINILFFFFAGYFKEKQRLENRAMEFQSMFLCVVLLTVEILWVSFALLEALRFTDVCLLTLNILLLLFFSFKKNNYMHTQCNAFTHVMHNFKMSPINDSKWSFKTFFVAYFLHKNGRMPIPFSLFRYSV